MSGIILPPAEVRLIIEKLAAYVVKNGKSFEDKILEKERHNPRFSFLLANDPYFPFYQQRLQEYHKIGPNKVDELLSRSREMERAATTLPEDLSDVRSNHAPSTAAVAPPEPRPLDFVVKDISTLPSALDYDVIKLTALYVARNGSQFMRALGEKEAGNVQFDFLRPENSLHKLFLSIVDQYTRVLIPSRSQREFLESYARRKYDIIDSALQRTEYERYVRAQQATQQEQAAEDALAYAQVDWNDFTVVEAVDFLPGETNGSAALPLPLDQSTVMSMSIVQRRELWNSQFVPRAHSHSGAALNAAQSEEADMDVEIISSSDQHLPKRVALSEVANPSAPPLFDQNYSAVGVPVKTNYIPRAAQLSAVVAESQYETCPMCMQSIEKSQISEHIRIESLDPKWKEQRDRYEAKHRETNYVSSGADVAQNLRSLQKAKIELAALNAIDVEKRLHSATLESAQRSVLWDGRVDPQSIAAATREAQAKAKPILQAQMQALEQQQQQELHQPQLPRRK
jgi:splicing factor 3A subunit 1